MTTAYVYLSNQFFYSGMATALVTLVPLIGAVMLLYFRTATIKQATILLGFFHSGSQLILQVTLLARYWNYLEGVLISYGTIDSPQYTMIVITCLSASLVVAKSARECHFICQAPDKPLRVTASYFRASPFFLLHILFRGLSLGFILSMLPIWLGLMLLLLFVLSNFAQLRFVFRLPRVQSRISCLTGVLSPTLFPCANTLSFYLIKKFTIINAVVTTVLLMTSALACQLIYGKTLCVKKEVPYALSLQTTTELSSSPTPLECFHHWSLQYGFVPHILLGGSVYMVLVVMIVGVMEPSWLILPRSFESRHNTMVSVKVPERSQHPFIDEPLKIIKVDKQDMLDNKEKQSLEELVDPILPVHLPPFTQFNLAKETKI